MYLSPCCSTYIIHNKSYFLYENINYIKIASILKRIKYYCENVRKFACKLIPNFELKYTTSGCKFSKCIPKAKKIIPRILAAVAVGPLTASKILQYLTKTKMSLVTFSWFYNCCGLRLRLSANRKFAVAIRLFDSNPGYE